MSTPPPSTIDPVRRAKAATRLLGMRVLRHIGMHDAVLASMRSTVNHALTGEIRAIIERHGVVGMSVEVALRDGSRVSFEHGVVDASRPERGAFGIATPCQAFSLGKPMVAALVVLLAAECVIDLDGSLWEQAGWWPAAGRCNGFDPALITVRHALAHSGGLGVHGSAWLADGHAHPAVIDLLEGRGGEAMSLVGPAGVHRYSGGAFVVLERVIERATGRSVHDLVREWVFTPLQMHESRLGDPDAQTTVRHDRRGIALPEARVASLTCSGLLTNARDLATFAWTCANAHRSRTWGTLSGLLERQVVSKGSAWTGLGWYLVPTRSDMRMHHSGHKEGAWCHAEGFVRRGCAFAITGNCDRCKDCGLEVSDALRTVVYERLA